MSWSVLCCTCRQAESNDSTCLGVTQLAALWCSDFPLTHLCASDRPTHSKPIEHYRAQSNGRLHMSRYLFCEHGDLYAG